MKQWYANELCKIAQVSVRTLHHYDRIDLLKPSLRLANGFRVYSEKDLLKLQQIIALKVFGFKLTQIKTLLENDEGLVQQLSLQSTFLQQQAKALLDASKTLDDVITSCKKDGSIKWEKTIELIEVYRMTQKLEHPWVSEVLNKEEIKQFAEFEALLKKRGPNEAEIFKNAWKSLMSEIESHLNEDPRSGLGIDIGKRCMEMVNAYYGKENINLRTKIWENGFMNESKRFAHGLSKEVTTWLENAVDAYWHDRAYTILNNIGNRTEKDLLKDWDQMLEDMYGKDDNRKNQLLDTIMDYDTINEEAKNWLKKHYG